MNAPAPTAALMSGNDYRASLRRLHADGLSWTAGCIESVADEPALAARHQCHRADLRLRAQARVTPLMTAVQHTSGKTRQSHAATSIPAQRDLLNKLEAVRLLCQETGCAQRYLTHDAVNAIGQVDRPHRQCPRQPGAHGRASSTTCTTCRTSDLALGVAMTDAKGDRSQRPHEQANVDSYVHIVERNAKGIVISGTKAIVTGAPYVHELLVMPCRNMGAEDADFAVCCAVAIDVPGLTIVARPAGRPGDKVEHGEALFSRKYGQSTGVCMFDRVFVPWERVFYAGDWEHMRPPDLQLCHAPPPHLHRRARRLRRPADRRRRADVRGQRLRSRPGDPSARADGRADQDRRGLLRLRRGGQRLRQARRAQRHLHARPGVRQHRQAAAGDADLRHAPHRALRLAAA